MPTALARQFQNSSFTRNSALREQHRGNRLARALLVLLFLLPCALTMKVAAQFPSIPKLEPPKLPKLPSLPGATPPPPPVMADPKPAAAPVEPDRPADEQPAEPNDAVETRKPAGGNRGALGKADAPSKIRPQFAPLVTMDFVASLDEFGSPRRATLQECLSAFASADCGPAPLQLAYGKWVISLLSNCRTPEPEKDMPARQLAAINVASNLRSASDHPRSVFTAELERRISLLADWIAAEAGRKGIDLPFASKGGKGRMSGVRTIEWGPIPGWNDDVISLTFDDGVVFDRQAKEESIATSIRLGFAPSRADWPSSVPPVEAIEGSVNVFLSKRPVAGTEKTVILQKLLVVDGKLLAAITVITGVEGEELVSAAQQQWAAVVKDLGTEAEVFERAAMGAVLSSFVTWADDRGTVTVQALNEIPSEMASSLVLKSSEYEFAAKTCTSVLVDESVRAAVREWTFDYGELTTEERAALVPTQGQIVLVLDCVAVGVDQSKFCAPIVTLVDAQGKIFKELGDRGREQVLRGLRGRHISNGGSGSDIAFDLSIAQLAKAERDGMSATHGPRARVFFVPADATGLIAKLSDCEQSLSMPVINPTLAYSRTPIYVQRTPKFSDSAAGANPKSAAFVIRQWGQACIVEAEAAKLAATQKEAAAAASAEAAAQDAEVERKKKLEGAFE